VSAACKEAGHPKAALGAQIVQHVATTGAAVAGAANVWQDRTKEKEADKKKADEEKGKAKEEPKEATETGTKSETERETKQTKTEPEKQTKETQTPPPKKEAQTDTHDLLHHDAEGAPEQKITAPPLEPEASTSGAKKEEKPAAPVKPVTAKEGSEAEKETKRPAPVAPKPAVSNPTIPESHEMKPLGGSKAHVA
jgi:hypothetical protein